MKKEHINILLVEDNHGDMVLIRESLKEIQGADYELTHVTHLRQACNLLKDRHHEVVLLDLALPDGTGVDNIVSIKDSDPMASIIVLTGLDNEQIAVEALRHGAQDYLHKGKADPEVLWRAMRYAVERKAIEKRLHMAKMEAEAATKTKSEFLAHMSHEIRSPLNVILGSIEALSGTRLDSEREKYLEICKASGELLLSVINDILDLSKLEAGKLQIHHESFDLWDMIANLKRFMSYNAEKKGTHLDFELDRGISRNYMGDPARLRQVLFNLLGNAVKFTENGAVSLHVGLDPQSSDSLLFTIKDTGIGIPAEQLEQIFEPFTQSTFSAARKFGGSGLGLAICKKLLDLMKGRIWAESRSGEGSVFYFTVECRPQTSQAEPVAPREPVAAANPLGNLVSSGETFDILVVDDSQDARLLLKAFLKSEKIKLEEAEHGAEALDRIQKDHFDLILLDMNMPEMSGYECAEKIRQWESESGRPANFIIALTAYSREAERDNCLKAGCNRYLRKPIIKEQLLRTLAECFDLNTGQGRRYRKAQSGEKVYLEAGLKAIVPRYLDKKRREIPVLRIALQKGDWEEVRRLGHNMAGTGVSYGFARISSIGKDLEGAARASDGTRALREIEILEQYLKEVEVVYQG